MEETKEQIFQKVGKATKILGSKIKEKELESLICNLEELTVSYSEKLDSFGYG